MAFRSFGHPTVNWYLPQIPVLLILVVVSVGFGILLKESFSPLKHISLALAWMTEIAAVYVAATPPGRSFLLQFMKGLS